MKNIYSLSACPVISGRKDTPTTTTCHNLRPDSAGLRPVGLPRRVAPSPWRQLAAMEPAPGRPLLILTDGLSLAAIDPAPREAPVSDDGMTDSPAPAPFATLDAEPLCALADSARLTVMTRTGAHIYIYNIDEDTWAESPAATRFPALSLKAVEAPAVSVTIGARTLGRTYPDSSAALTDSDRRAVSSDLRRAYLALCRQAAARRVFCAPLICRYRLVSPDNQTVFTSAPVLVTTADNSRFAPVVTADSDDRRTVAPYSVSLPAFSLVLSSSGPVADEFMSSVGRIEIVACPPFFAYDSKDDADISPVSDGVSRRFLSMTLPGAANAVSPSAGGAGAARLRACLSALPALERVIAVIRPTFGGKSVRAVIDAPADSPAEAVAAISAAATRRVAEADHVTASISQPHSFSAGCVSSVSGVALWGQLSPLRFGGYPLETFAAGSDTDAAWHAAAAVTFADGRETVVSTSQGDTGAPLLIEPLVSYPSADAVSMTLTVTSGGTVRRSVLPLTADPSGHISYYIHPSLSPFELDVTDTPFVVPAARAVARTLDGWTALAQTSSPMTPAAAVRVCSSAVTAIAPAVRRKVLSDRSRSAFSVFTLSGIHTLTFSSVAAPVSVSFVSKAVVGPAGNIALAPDCLYAVSGASVIRVTSTEASAVLSLPSPSAVAWSDTFDELWIACGDGRTLVFSPRGRTLFSRDTAFTSALAHYIFCDNGTYDLNREDSQPSAFVRFACDIPLGDVFPSRIRGVAVDMHAATVSNGEASLYRMARCIPEPVPSVRLAFDGSLKSRLPIAILPAHIPARAYSLSVQARVSPDFRLHSLSIIQ